jgi:hypothetical protein
MKREYLIFFQEEKVIIFTIFKKNVVTFPIGFGLVTIF